MSHNLKKGVGGRLHRCKNFPLFLRHLFSKDIVIKPNRRNPYIDQDPVKQIPFDECGHPTFVVRIVFKYFPSSTEKLLSRFLKLRSIFFGSKVGGGDF